MWNRREFLKGAALAGGVVALPGLSGCAMGSKARGHVVVVGGGFGGATVAKYLRMWSQMGVDVTLVERSPQFISCPISNLVIGGDKQMADITMSYDGLRNTWGVKVLQDTVTAVDAGARKVTLASGGVLSYDRLVLSPGIEFMYDQVPGLETEAARDTVLHAWKAGAQTVALRKQLEDMPGWRRLCDDDSQGALPLPARALRARLPGGQLPAEDQAEVQGAGAGCQRGHVSKKGLFTKAFEKYKGILEYRPQSELREVDAASRTAMLEFDKVKADVLNVVPPQRAGDIAAKSGLKLSTTAGWISTG
jgi:sulfide dehydrogenase [flavocytochrome c] flavoprotein subunit